MRICTCRLCTRVHALSSSSNESKGICYPDSKRSWHARARISPQASSVRVQSARGMRRRARVMAHEAQYLTGQLSQEESRGRKRCWGTRVQELGAARHGRTNYGSTSDSLLADFANVHCHIDE